MDAEWCKICRQKRMNGGGFCFLGLTLGLGLGLGLGPPVHGISYMNE